MTKEEQYEHVLSSIRGLINGESDTVAIMATVACELHHQFDYFHWTGFYRVTEPRLLTIGPYQGSHGCLHITFDRGVCGKAAREELTQVVEDVHALPYHIACSSTTKSEIVVPLFDAGGKLVGVLDVDSNDNAAFDEVDKRYLESICKVISLQI